MYKLLTHITKTTGKMLIKTNRENRLVSEKVNPTVDQLRKISQLIKNVMISMRPSASDALAIKKHLIP